MLLRIALSALSTALVASFVSFWLFEPEHKPNMPSTSGRKDTVLYLTDSSSGLSNSQIASASALLGSQPDIQLYWGSFANPPMEPQLRRLSDAARHKSADAKPIIFHLMGTASLMEVMYKTYPSFDAFITDYGLKGYDKMLQIVQNVLMPWTPEEYLALYEETGLIRLSLW
ncbi:uncharacterized protein DSM5745_03292 [Aspergillus mulundensis]|uniref:Uncharacterized protein n=1 Tax=Aspergillus mulundensis TaxID=1810919 RepID=A0A3D8SJZ8_9EURO|nr:hypothetical protein DSM5745_03292 [Aspergillus mulundensis]RDW86650.1 hypothetical protein DSM5745_03292 [Aspergillus mulundensis]